VGVDALTLNSSIHSSPPLIAVTGAGGFIGRYVVSHLLEQGWRVRAMVRECNAFDADLPLDVVRADLRDAHAVTRALAGADAVVHLAAAKADEADSEQINVEGARHLIAACRLSGCRRIINVSTISTKIPRKGLYGRTKLAADRLFAESGLDVTTLLLSVVYDDARGGIPGVVLRTVERLPVVPVLGDGRWVSAPVHVEDVSAAISACLRTERTIGRTYDIGGPDQLIFDELVRTLARSVSRDPVVFHVPLPLALLLARALRLMPQPPVTVSNVLGSNQNVPIDIAPARVDFGFSPRRFRISEVRREGLGDARAASVIDAEGRLLARHLMGVDPAPELVERYEAACARLFLDENDPVLAFVRRHGWALPLLDAAVGVMRPASGLRQRLVVMAAILEATPRHSPFFMAEPGGRAPLLAALALQAVRSSVACAVGIPLLLWVTAQERWSSTSS
jgi:NADH dehydrogenase